MPPENTNLLEKETPEAMPAQTPSVLRNWIPLGITFLLMPVLAYAMTEFVLIPRLQRDLGIIPKNSPAVKESAEKEKVKETRESFPMTKLLVNVAGTMGGRYLLVSLSIEGAGPDYRSKIQAHEPKLRDLACSTLATKTLADLEKPGARNLIRSELIAGFNNLLGSAMVEEIYLTEFAVQ